MNREDFLREIREADLDLRVVDSEADLDLRVVDSEADIDLRVVDTRDIDMRDGIKEY